MYPLSDNRYFHLFTEYEGWTNKMKHRAKTAKEHSTVANASGHNTTPTPSSDLTRSAYRKCPLAFLGDLQLKIPLL